MKKWIVYLRGLNTSEIKEKAKRLNHEVKKEKQQILWYGE